MSLNDRFVKVEAQFAPIGSLRARFLRSSAWSLAANVAYATLQLAALTVISRFLGKEGFGELGILSSTVQLLGVLTGSALGMSATRHVAEWRASDPERAGRMVALSTSIAAVAGLSMAAVLALAAPWIAASVFNAPHLLAELRIASGLLLFTTLMGVQNAVLAGLESFRAIARINVVRGALNFPAAIVGAWQWGVRGAMLGLVAGAAAGWMASQVSVRRECRRGGVAVHYGGLWSEASTLWQFSLPAFLASVATSSAMWLGNTLLVRSPGGYAEMGVFNAANQWRIAITFLPVVMNQALLPILSSLNASGDPAQLRRAFLRALMVVSGVAVAVAAPVALLSPYILSSFGLGYREHWPVLAILALSAIPMTSASVTGVMITSAGRMWWVFALNALWAAVFIAAAFVGDGARGLAHAYLFAYASHTFTSAIAIRRLLSLGAVRPPPQKYTAASASVNHR